MGDKLGEELMFDVDADLEADDVAWPSPGALRCKSRRLRFPHRQAELKAYTGKIDDSIEDTHLQHDLKRHPFAQALKGQVCYSFPFCLLVWYIYYVC